MSDEIIASLDAAMRAPSSHNTQPWKFRVEPGVVRLYADRSRALPVNDPGHRELTISCGAALLNLVLALGAGGASPKADLLPDPSEADLLAVVHLRGGPPATPEDNELSAAIALRQTCRTGFDVRPMPAELLSALTSSVASNGARLEIVTDEDARRRLGQLVVDGDRLQWSNRRWRRELAAWMRPRRRGDGLVTPRLSGALTRAAVGQLDLGFRIAQRDRESVVSAPVLAILTTPSDEPRDWLAAGMALEATLLRGAVRGIQAAYLNQPLQVPSLRPEVASLVTDSWAPQMVLRLGYPLRDRALTPRRPLDEVIL